MRKIDNAKYEELKASGMLDNDGMKLYEVLMLNGPLTRGEAWKLFRESTGRNVSRHGFVSRMAALQRRGLIDKVDPEMTRLCAATGERSLVWDVMNGDTVAVLADH